MLTERWRFPPAGKSSLAVQFVDGHFVESYYPTIENTFSKVIRFKSQDYATEIVDTAGQVRPLPLHHQDPDPAIYTHTYIHTAVYTHPGLSQTANPCAYRMSTAF